MPGILDTALGTLGAVSDRLVSVVAPRLALGRAEARARLHVANMTTVGWQQPADPSRGYGRHGASRSKRSLVGWLSTLGDASEDAVKHLEGDGGLRARSRDLWMGTALARAVLQIRQVNSVGAGLTLAPQVDAEFLGLSDDEADAWERDTSRRFGLWAESTACDAAGLFDFYEQQTLAFLSADMSGDVFALLHYEPRADGVSGLQLQLLEADRVCDPWPLPRDLDIVGGVECGERGRLLAYYVAPVHPAGDDWRALKALTSADAWTRVPVVGAHSGARQILHVLGCERPEQRRGVPVLAGVMELLKQIGRYTESELMAAVVTSYLSVFVTSENPDRTLGKMADGEDGTGTDGAAPVTPVTTGETGSSDDRGPIELGPGTVSELLPGEKIETVLPNRPSGAFAPFVQALCVQLGTALDVPYEILLRHFTSSYTAARGAFVEFAKPTHVRRQRFASRFCRPAYEEWLALEVAEGRIACPGFSAAPEIRRAWSGSEWYGPAMGQINEKVEAEGANARVVYGFSTREREAAQLTGQDWHRVIRQRQREVEKERAAGMLPPAQQQPVAPAQGA